MAPVQDIIVLDTDNKIWFINIVGDEGMITAQNDPMIKGFKGPFISGGARISSIKKGEKSLGIYAESLKTGNCIYVLKKVSQKEELLKCIVKSAFLRMA